MNWGKGLAVTMGAFIVFIVAMVFVMMQNDDSLYEEDYYTKGEAHTEIMKEEEIALKIDANYQEQGLHINLHGNGTVSFINLKHMGNKAYDRKLVIPDSAKAPYALDLSDLPAGVWYADINGHIDDQPFLKKMKFVAP